MSLDKADHRALALWAADCARSTGNSRKDWRVPLRIGPSPDSLDGLVDKQPSKQGVRGCVWQVGTRETASSSLENRDRLPILLLDP